MLNNIEAERARKTMTQGEFSDKFGISPKTYRSWISEETPIPSSTLLKMARFFNVSTDYLLEGASVDPV